MGAGMSTVTYRLSGRLGNQLQLWACARTISLRYGLDFAFRPFTCDLSPLRPVSYDRVLGRREIVSAAVKGRLHRLQGHDWDESGNERGVLRSDLVDGKRLLLLDWSGIFTRVDDFRDTLVNELVGAHTMPSVDPRAVAIHYRQGDAIYPQPLSFYVRALKRMGVGRGDTVAVFSDGDAACAAASIRDATGATVTLPHDTAMGDMLHMSAHSRLVLSQSWFSYWAAFLSDGEEVVTPPDFRYYPEWSTA